MYLLQAHAILASSFGSWHHTNTPERAWSPVLLSLGKLALLIFRVVLTISQFGMQLLSIEPHHTFAQLQLSCIALLAWATLQLDKHCWLSCIALLAWATLQLDKHCWL
jgi:hypothetical protein